MIQLSPPRSLTLKGVLFDGILILATPWYPDPAIQPPSRKGHAVLEIWEENSFITRP